jgi:hypothetical protein
MGEYLRLLSFAAFFAGAAALVAHPDERHDARSLGPIYNVVHFEVITATIGGRRVSLKWLRAFVQVS